MKQLKIFQAIVVLIFLVFISILIFVLVYANMRKSGGSTGLNMTNIQEMRVNAEKEKKQQQR